MELYQFLFSIIALTVVKAGPATDSYKDQFCTDPRTMRKHAAYTEWADAYSCTRHRCQPGGRNLAIYTVGCKRVEAPESAIECEEVVEDTNMQFPYCCTRLRCLVVVRGEVWTRVLGQPWETLPAAPWSHMYKMKKPPPGDTAFLPKSPGEGPVYELATETERDAEKVLRSGQRSTTEAADFESEAKPMAMAMAMAPPAPAPDIVIALSTSNDEKSVIKERQERPEQPEHQEHAERPEHPERPVKKEGLRERRKRGRKGNQNAVMARDNFFEEDQQIEPRVQEPELEEPVLTEKPLDPQSDEKFYANAYGVTQRIPKTFQKSHNQQVSWTEIPQNQWNEHEHEHEVTQAEPETRDHHQPEYPPTVAEVEKKEEKPGNLQALVDAIGTRMRDIESVVQRMSEKVVQQVKPGEEGSAEKDKEKKSETRAPQETPEVHKHQPREGKVKKPNPDGEHYKRFHGSGSKYVHGTVDATTEKPLFVEDSNLNGYFSDASNTVRRASPPKEPAATYMAPVENHRKSPPHAPAEGSDEVETRRRKKHSHKKKKTKSSHHKKHHDKRKRFNRLNSVELDKNTVSLEDSNPDGNK